MVLRCLTGISGYPIEMIISLLEQVDELMADLLDEYNVTYSNWTYDNHGRFPRLVTVNADRSYYRDEHHNIYMPLQVLDLPIVVEYTYWVGAVAIGSNASYSGQGAIAIGNNAHAVVHNSIAIGTNGQGAIVIGYDVGAVES